MMDHLDQWYKEQVNQQNIPPYTESMWEKASAFIHRAEKINNLLVLSRVVAISLLCWVFIPTLFQKSISNNSLQGQNQYAKTFLNINNNSQGDNIAQQESHHINTPIDENNQGTNSTISHTKDQVTTQPVNKERVNKSIDILQTSNQTTREVPQPIVASTKAIQSEDILQNDMPLVSNSSGDKMEPLRELVWHINELQTALSTIIFPEMQGSFRAESERKESYFDRSIFLSLPFSINNGAEKGRWMGANIGMKIDYHLRQNWVIGTGLGYAMRQGPIGVIHDHPQIIYDFEMIDHGYRMEIDQLHYAFIPVSLHRKVNKIQIGVEYRLMHLVNAHALVSEYNHHRDFSDNGVLVHTDMLSQKKGWSRPEGLRRLNHEFAFSSTYQISEKIRAGVQITYNPSGMTDDNFGLKYSLLENNYNQTYAASRPFTSKALFAEFSMHYSW